MVQKVLEPLKFDCLYNDFLSVLNTLTEIYPAVADYSMRQIMIDK